MTAPIDGDHSAVRGVGLRCVLVSLCIGQITSWGVLYYAFTVMSPAISEDTGWSAPAVTAAFSSALVISAVLGIAVGRWLDRIGPRAIMTTGALLGPLTLVGVATAPNFGWFLTAWIAAGVAMSGVLYAPAFAALTRWFGPRAVGALTALTLVAGLASTVFAPLTAALLSQLGSAQYVSRPHCAIGRRHDSAALLRVATHMASPPNARCTNAPTTTARSRPFVVLTVAFALAALASYAVVVNLVPLMAQRGISTGAAAVALGLGGAGTGLGPAGLSSAGPPDSASCPAP